MSLKRLDRLTKHGVGLSDISILRRSSTRPLMMYLLVLHFLHILSGTLASRLGETTNAATASDRFATGTDGAAESNANGSLDDGKTGGNHLVIDGMSYHVLWIVLCITYTSLCILVFFQMFRIVFNRFVAQQLYIANSYNSRMKLN